ncbi:hypothetical protein [Paraburkholderia caledonica]|uniref:hypothetical protein n=1 Tax=Paraburkholderia caledonica TaxID=134536 RepID=UPI000B48F860
MRYLIVDTNCFLRIYQSNLRPFLGANVGDLKVVTLQSLVDEFLHSERLMTNYAWLEKDIAGVNPEVFSMSLTVADEKDIAVEIRQLGPWGNKLLEGYCRKQAIKKLRVLSKRDIQLLATAAVVEGVIASDEWPMKLVVDELTRDDDDYCIEIITSIDVLSLLEVHGRMSSEERRATVRSWLIYEEQLPRGWEEIYVRLFGEPPPKLQ